MIMKRFYYIFLLFLTSYSSTAQEVFSVKYPSQADVKVYVAEHESQADLLVYKVKYKSQAGNNDGSWFFVDYASEADKKIYYVEYKSQADIIVFFVEFASKAKWRSNNKKHFFFRKISFLGGKNFFTLNHY